MSQDSHGTAERLVKAYERMMERVHATLEHAEKQTLPNLQNHIDQAREKAVELEELTREEADRIATYLKRDMHDAARFLNDSGEALSRWLRFDLSLIEDRMLDMLSGVADQTRLELMQLQERAVAASAYRTGEITGPGTLQCAACDKQIHFHKTAHIPPCPKCRHTEFRRVDEDVE